MGPISSLCKRPHTDSEHNTNAFDDYFYETILKKKPYYRHGTHCSVISREPTPRKLTNYNFYSPEEQQVYRKSITSFRGTPDFPLFSTPFFVPYNGVKSSKNPYIAFGYNSSSSVATTTSTNNDDTGRSQENVNPPALVQQEISFKSTTVQTVELEKRDNSSQTILENENVLRRNAPSLTSHVIKEDQQNAMKRTTSAPIDMFLVDISHEYVAIDHPVTLNIRHLFLDNIENQQNSLSKPILIEPSTTTTYANESLIDYIPRVCDRYPHSTISPSQPTKTSMHLRVPSMIPKSVEAHI